MSLKHFNINESFCIFVCVVLGLNTNPMFQGVSSIGGEIPFKIMTMPKTLSRVCTASDIDPYAPDSKYKPIHKPNVLA